MPNTRIAAENPTLSPKIDSEPKNQQWAQKLDSDPKTSLKIDSYLKQLAPGPKKTIVKICPRKLFSFFIFFSLDKIQLKSCNFIEKMRKPTFESKSRVLKKKKKSYGQKLNFKI